MPTIAQAISSSIKKLEGNTPTPHIDTTVLMCYTLGCSTAYLMSWPERELEEEHSRQFDSLIKQREKGMPIAYLTSAKEFWSIKFKVTPATLIPRPETETLVECVLDVFGAEEELDILDLGTGCGAIAIAIASEKPDWNIIATDISEYALAVAKENADRQKTKNITFIQSNWFEKLNNKTFDVILSNPPYVADSDPHLSLGDVRMEPDTALKSGPDGMDDIRKITVSAQQHLNNTGCLVLEHGYNQKEAVYDCLREARFKNIRQENDWLGQPRVSAGCKSAS